MNNKIGHIFFIGIGGISMSGLAEMMLNNGVRVSGSDSNDSQLVQRLKKDGAKIYLGHNKENITNDIDLVVYTSAINDDNAELVRAKELGLSIQGRTEFIGSIMKEYKHSIAVSGTHGKTTTTGMLSSILISSEFNPTIFLGGELDAIGGNIKIGSKDLLLTEACEYKRNFLNFFPTIGIILNIDEDHLDYYKDINDINSAFQEFANKISEDGLLVVNNKHSQLFDNVSARVITFGLDEASDIYATNIEYLPNPRFSAVYKGSMLGNVELGVFGEHNVLNSLSAMAAALELGIDFNTIADGLNKFKGTKRRFELKGVKEGVSVIDDYAHHPEEIRATLTSAAKMIDGKIIVVFQPHTFTRTKALMDEFAKVFELADDVVVIDIYASREKDTGIVNSHELVNTIKAYNNNVMYAGSFDEAALLALKKANSGDIIITMGAGNVNKVADLILE